MLRSSAVDRRDATRGVWVLFTLGVARRAVHAHRAWRSTPGRSVALGDVEDMHDPKPAQDTDHLGLVILLVVVDATAPGHDRSQHGDALLTPSHLVAEALPPAIAPHPGGARKLAQDKQDVGR